MKIKITTDERRFFYKKGDILPVRAITESEYLAVGKMNTPVAVPKEEAELIGGFLGAISNKSNVLFTKRKALSLIHI